MIFSNNKGRITVIVVLLILLVALMHYGFKHYPSVTLQMCLDNPTRYHGTEIGIGTEATISKLDTDGFFIQQMGNSVKVFGEADNVRLGDFVQMRAIFHKAGYLELRQLYIAKKRRQKIVVSIAPTVLVLVLFLKTYKFDLRRFLFCERNDA